MTVNKQNIFSGYPYRVTFIIFAIGLLALLPAYFIPSWRSQLYLFTRNSERKILATLVEDLDHSGNPVSVFKVKEKDSLYLEIYSAKIAEEVIEALQSRSYDLIQKIELPGTIDGYVSFMSQATNLAVANLDNDPYLEVIIPSYNSEFVASLDIVKFNPILKKFELMSSFDIPDGFLGNFSKESH